MDAPDVDDFLGVVTPAVDSCEGMVMALARVAKVAREAAAKDRAARREVSSEAFTTATVRVADARLMLRT
eukprot:CAMPEP_0114229836 /NCGR_PEP_ID=MMETSP0058-20121206/3131_1 /TAXON_ID=36894 /ORGANISM="Pyramimonas parkeae, CCMP726" /LENGTH=69 /DNA_ID=CAMNT_0001340961 /DNA_START=552 /DNA_END=761 /DNA_ORIENTATION=+